MASKRVTIVSRAAAPRFAASTGSRANAAIAAGADLAFVEAVQTLEEMAEVTRRVNGPCLLNIVPGGKTPAVSLADAQAMGYRLAILPGMLLREVMVAIDRALRALRETGTPAPATPGATVAGTFRRFGADEWDGLRRAYAEAPGA